MGKRQEAAKLTREHIVCAAEPLHEERGLEICKEWMKSAVCPTGGEGRGMEMFRYDRSYIARSLEDARASGELRADAPAEEITDAILAEYYGCVALWSMSGGAFPMRARMVKFAGALERHRVWSGQREESQ